MIQRQFVENLNSDIYFNYVGTEGTIELFVFENIAGCWLFTIKS